MAAKPLEETLWRAKGFFGARRTLTVRSWLIILLTVFTAVVLAINKSAPVIWFGILFIGIVKAFELDDWLTRKVAGVWLEQIKPLSIPVSRPSFAKFFVATFLVTVVLLGFTYYQLDARAFLALSVFAIVYVFLPITNAHLQATDFLRKNPCTVGDRIPVKRVRTDGLAEDEDGQLTAIGAINGNLPGKGLTADDPAEIRADAFARLLLAVAVFNQRRGGTVKMYFLTEPQAASSSKITDSRLSRFQLSVLLAYHPDLEENLRDSLLDIGLELTRLNRQEAVAFVNTFWSQSGFVNHLDDNPGTLVVPERITYDAIATLSENHTAVVAALSSPAGLSDIEAVVRNVGANLCLTVNVQNQRKVVQELKGRGSGLLMLFDRQQRQDLDELKKAFFDPDAKNCMLEVLVLISINGRTPEVCIQKRNALVTGLSRRGIGVMPLGKRALEEGFLACLPVVNDTPAGAFDAVSAAKTLAETSQLNGFKVETLSKPVTEQLANRPHGDWSDLGMLHEGPDTIYLGTGIRGSPQRDIHAKPYEELFLIGMLGNQRYGKSTMAGYMVRQIWEKRLLWPVVINPNAGDRTWEQFITGIGGEVVFPQRDEKRFRNELSRVFAGHRPILYQASGTGDPAKEPCLLVLSEMVLEHTGLFVVIEEVHTFTAYEFEAGTVGQVSRNIFRLIKQAGHSENAICVITQRPQDLQRSQLGDLIAGEVLGQSTAVVFHLEKLAADDLERLSVPQLYRQQVEKLGRGEFLLATRGGGEARDYYVLKLALSLGERQGLRKERVQFHDRPLLR